MRFLSGLSAALAGMLLAACGSSVVLTAGAGAGAFTVYKDNWEIAQTRLEDDTFQLALHKNVLRTDGDAEGSLVFKRHSADIARENGYAGGCRTMEYSEGIESTMFGAQRVANGVIRCERKKK